MPIVADASVAIRGDMSGFHRDLQGAERATQGFAGRIKNIFSPRNVAMGAGLFGVGLGVQNLVRVAGDAAQAYGELEQTIRTIDDVFGDSAQVIHEWGETAAETAGMSQQTFMSSAAIMGQTLKNMGFTIEEAAERTVELLGRAADLAIAFGKRPQDALLAITAAMRGERDTIEKFGIAIKQVDVNARIAALGLDTSTAAAKKNAEAMAVVDLVLEQSADQAGRFANSQNDIAVQMAQVNAHWDDFLAKDVGAAVASIQLGAFKVGDAVAGWRAPLRDALDGFSMFLGPQRSQIMKAADDMGLSFEELRQRIAGLMEGGGVSFEVAFVQATAPSDVEASIRGVASQVKAQLQAEEPALSAAAYDALANPIIVAMLGGQEEAERIAGETPDGIAQALLDAQFVVRDAFEELARVGVEALTPMKEKARIEGFLASQRLADALASNKPAVAQRARELKEAAEARLAELSGAAFFHGLATAQSYAAGMNAGYGFVQTAAGNLAAATRNQIGINSEPEDHSSPLYGITKWGGNLVRTYAEGILNELGTGTSAAAALAGALTPPMIGSGAGMVQGGVGGGDTYVLQVEGKKPEVGARDDVLSRWEQMARLGR